MTTVKGIEAIKLYMPPTKEQINVNIKEERGQVVANAAASNKEQESQPRLLTSVERYRQEWNRLLYLVHNKPETIRESAFKGSLKVSKFRSIYWAVLLRVLTSDASKWVEQRTQQRLRFEKLQKEFVSNPHEINSENDDPLSQSTKSAWNQYFNNQELFAIIKQDVVRTFPGVDFFRKEQIQQSLCNILFYYAREHPYMNYRQGMHEILAPLLFVMYGDQQSLLHFLEVEQQQMNELTLAATLKCILNVQHLEADTYALFSRLMSLIESYYRVPNTQLLGDSLDAENMHNLKARSESEVIGQLNLIRDKILFKEDAHLHNYLLKLEIPLHIFGIRWLRLLFGREFPLLDLLMIWDAIFADSDRFELPNYILVAMLIRIRDKLLLSDFTTCMTYLMRYPTNLDVNVILQHALHMYMPKNFEMPANAFTYFMNEKPEPRSSSKITDNYQNNVNLLGTHNFSNADFTSLMPTATVSLLNMPKRLNSKAKIPTSRDRSTSFDSQPFSRELKPDKPSSRRALVEDQLRVELNSAQAVIKITNHKLQAYNATLKQHTSVLMQHKLVKGRASQEIQHSLQGIDELCKFMSLNLNRYKQRQTAVDYALEANETQPQTSSNSQKQVIKLKEIVVGNDVTDAAKSAYTKNAYELPDNEFSPQRRLPQEFKEFEMLQINKAENALDLEEATHKRANNMNGTFPIANPLLINSLYDQ